MCSTRRSCPSPALLRTASGSDSRLVSGNGREFYGRPDRHPYDLFLQLEQIEHHTTQVRRPQSNGLVKWFHQPCLRGTGQSKGARSSMVLSKRCSRTWRTTWPLQYSTASPRPQHNGKNTPLSPSRRDYPKSREQGPRRPLTRPSPVGGLSGDYYHCIFGLFNCDTTPSPSTLKHAQRPQWTCLMN